MSDNIERSTPTPNNSIAHRAAGNLGFLLSVIRCGEPLSHEEEANVRKVIKELGDHERIVKELEAQIRTVLVSSAPAPPLDTIYKAIEAALNGYRMHHTRELPDLPDLDNGLSLLDRLTPDEDKDVTRGREELGLLIDYVCGAVGDVFRASPAQPPADAAVVAAREVVDAIWGEAMKLAQSFVDANIRNYNDHKGVDSLERVYDAKRDTAQQIVNQMHNFNEARWHKPKAIAAIISKHCGVQTWCDHCSADLNGVKHTLCNVDYQDFANQINTRETLRSEVLDWLAHRCDYAPTCGNCTYCRVAAFVREVEPSAPAVPAAPSATWATVNSTCRFCGREVSHVCTAFLKDAAPSAQPWCTCPKEARTVGYWTARYRDRDCPVHGEVSDPEYWHGPRR